MYLMKLGRLLLTGARVDGHSEVSLEAVLVVINGRRFDVVSVNAFISHS